MIAFTSTRERRLWGWALAVVVAIYSTVGLAGRLAETLRNEGLLGLAFTVAFVSVIAAVVGIALQRRPRAGEVWVIVGVTAAFAMIIVRMGVDPIERTHLFEYGLVAVLIYEALKERQLNGRPVPRPTVLAVVATALLGWIDEGIQAFLPNRVYDLRDVGVNALAGLFATGASVALGWARSRRKA